MQQECFHEYRDLVSLGKCLGILTIISTSSYFDTRNYGQECQMGGTGALQNLKVARSWGVNKEPAGSIPARKEVCFSLLSGWRFLWMPSFSRCWALNTTTSQSHRFSGERAIPTQCMGLEHHMKLRVWKRYCLSPRLQLRVCTYLWKAAVSCPDFRCLSQHWSPFTQSFIFYSPLKK